VSAIMQEIWVNPEHRQRLEEISQCVFFLAC